MCVSFYSLHTKVLITCVYFTKYKLCKRLNVSLLLSFSSFQQNPVEILLFRKCKQNLQNVNIPRTAKTLPFTKKYIYIKYAQLYTYALFSQPNKYIYVYKYSYESLKLTSLLLSFSQTNFENVIVRKCKTKLAKCRHSRTTL